MHSPPNSVVMCFYLFVSVVSSFILGFWVHCNDSKLNMCTMEEVCKAQAYILFYSQRLTQANGHGKVCPSTAESQQHTELADCSVENSSS